MVRTETQLEEMKMERERETMERMERMKMMEMESMKMIEMMEVERMEMMEMMGMKMMEMMEMEMALLVSLLYRDFGWGGWWDPKAWIGHLSGIVNQAVPC